MSADNNTRAVSQLYRIKCCFVETTLTQSVSLPTLASDFTASTSEKPRKSVRISLEPTTFLESEFSTGIEGAFQGPGILRAPSQPRQFETMDVKIIHAELMNIHMYV